MKKIVKYSHLITGSIAHVFTSIPHVTGSLENGHYKLGLKYREGSRTEMTCC